jgi:1,2-diacylglycerol-3-alpha-glucose alpha-1,2-glucosyltransferase
MKICLYSEFYKAFGGKDNIGGGLISALENQKKILNFLNISFTEDYKDSWDVLQVNIPWPMSLHKAIKAKKDGKKVIMWSHVTVEDLEKSVKLFKVLPGMSYIIKKYLKYAYSIPNMVFCPTQYTKNVLISYGLKPDTLFVQSNAVDINKFFKDIKSRDEYRIKYSLNGLVIGNMALVMYRKGIDTFIKLAEIFSQNQFIWFGKIFSKLFVQRTSLNTPKNTNFTGFVDNANSALNALDIFLFPSYEENQGMVILEAAAVGLPILIRNLPAYEGWLIHDKNCFKANNDEEFEKYLNLLINDDELRNRLGKEALLLAQRESIPVLAKKLKLIYEKL